MFEKIDHVEIIPSDFERSIRFYRDMLGFETWQRQAVDNPPLEEIAYLRLGDSMIEVMKVNDPAPPGDEQWQVGYRMMALEVEDMDEALAYCEEKGIEITWGPVDMGGTKRAEIEDPDGLGIEIREW